MLKKNFLLLSMFKTVVLLLITSVLFQDSSMNKKFQRTAFIWNRNIF